MEFIVGLFATIFVFCVAVTIVGEAEYKEAHPKPHAAMKKHKTR